MFILIAFPLAHRGDILHLIFFADIVSFFLKLCVYFEFFLIQFPVMEVTEDWRYLKSNILMYREVGFCLSPDFDLASSGYVLNLR